MATLLEQLLQIRYATTQRPQKRTPYNIYIAYNFKAFSLAENKNDLLKLIKSRWPP